MSRSNRRRSTKSGNNISKNKNLFIIVIALAVIAVGAFVFLSGSDDTKEGVVNEVISPAEYQNQFASREHVLVDVRTPAEYESGIIPDAININVEELASRVDELPKDQPIVVYCRSGNRSAVAADILAEAGFSEVYDLGGIQTWQSQGNPVVLP